MQYAATDTLGTHPKRVLHTVQAEVLLAVYLFRNGRFLEAKAHLGSAVSLVLSTQMHRLRSSRRPPFTLVGITNDAPIFPQYPQHNTEEGEQINGFWAVYSLHKLLSFALDPSSDVCGALEAPGLQIDTPWPFENHDYRNVSENCSCKPTVAVALSFIQGCLTTDILGNSTIKHFLSGISPTNRNDVSFMALAVKASILCHRATHLAGQWMPSMQSVGVKLKKSCSYLLRYGKSRIRDLHYFF